MDESGKEKQMLANNSGGIMARLILIDALKVGALYAHCTLHNAYFPNLKCKAKRIITDI